MRLSLVFVLLAAACGTGVSSNPGSCIDSTRNGNETDVDCGGGSCARCGNGLTCQVPTDCASNTCVAQSCAAPPAECADGVKGAIETDVDCGGGTCPACANGKACQLNGDCQSNACDHHVCTTPPPACADDVQGGNETDVDCGGGTCAPCGNGKKCAGPGDCVSNNCAAGTCATPPSLCKDGVISGNETDVDCGGGTCAPCGNGKKCTSPGDCASNTCKAGTCATPPVQCSDNQKNGAETDVDCGGGTCPACANGKACASASDCASGNCASHVCAAPPTVCSDGMKGPTETDVDCGGVCPPCASGKGCTTGGDCTSGSCQGFVCKAPGSTCANGVKDGTETDVDCGGGCAACALGKQCAQGSDCGSGLCNGLCVAPAGQCADGAKNGAETDVDCGGGVCPGCALGKACTGPGDCAGGACTAGVCSVPPAACMNGVKDNAETDVDCGGSACPGCGAGKTCKVQTDCAGGLACDLELLQCRLLAN
jgi:hypothetical protein